MWAVFTGIIQHIGSVVSVGSSPAGQRLRIDIGPLRQSLAEGASMAVDGVCLTASGFPGRNEADFDVVPETLRRSSLGRLHAGARVNLEKAVPAGGALDGHIVQGHVDGLAELSRIDRSGGEVRLFCRCDAEVTGQMVPKGSVALSGISLTLADVRDGEFSVAIVPATLERTTLAQARISDMLNVELDIIGKYVCRYLQGMLGPAGVTMEQLRRTGFL